MPDYDFKNLSPIDFESFVRDLVQADVGIRLESFKAGRDQGIDFRFSRGSSENVIVQCKHFAGSTFRDLLRHLRTEATKVVKLKPCRYILATSIGLSPANKEKIQKIFGQFIKNSRDIYGRDDLNNLLGLHPDVERRNFKLWLTSLPLFEEFFNKKVRNISREALETIREHARSYVQNESFDEARRLIERHGVCVIAGIPGIGKTTLAEMLVLNYVHAGYQLVRITSDIAEASAVDYQNVPRIFYYDDFLGQTALSDKLNKNEDQHLIDFIHAIRRSKKSKFILTTREYILNQARFLYEKLAREDFSLVTCVVDLEKYTRRNKAQILFNHLYFSDLPVPYKKAIIGDGRYLEIIDHTNFSPRIISLLTSSSRACKVEPGRYVSFVLERLNNPSDLWKHAFEGQISFQSQSLLITLACMPVEVLLEDARIAFQQFYKLLVTENGEPLKPNAFERALRELDGNFVISERYGDAIVVTLHNPSIRDYLNSYMQSHKEYLKQLIESASFFDQIVNAWEIAGCGDRRSDTEATCLNILEAMVVSLRRTMGTDGCRLISYRMKNGELRKNKWEISVEERANFLMKVAIATSNEDIWSLFEKVTPLLQERIRKRNASRRELMSLALKHRGTKYEVEIRKGGLLSDIVEYIANPEEDVDEFMPFVRLSETWPEIVPPKLRASFEEAFRNLIDGYEAPHDPQAIRDDAESIERIGVAVNIYVERVVRGLEEKAEKLEEWEQDVEEGDGVGVEDECEEWCSDDDIHSLFRTFGNLSKEDGAKG